MKKIFIILCSTLAVFGLVVIVPAINVSALYYNQGTYGTCTYNSCYISITSASNISVSLTPNNGGSCSVGKNDVSVLTDSSTGDNLSLSVNSVTGALTNGSGGNIYPSSGTFSSPQALGINKWGYRVDGTGGFGSGPTGVIADQNYPISNTFAAAPYGSTPVPDIVASSSLAADPAVTTSVWYGVCADTSISSGLYTGTILYTATTN